MIWNGTPPDPEEDDDEVPEALRDRWARRDRQYSHRLYLLDESAVRAIRELRVGEAEAVGDKALIEEARYWELGL